VKFGQWFGFFVIVLSLYILWQIRQLVLLIFTAVILATALNRLVRRLQLYGIKRNLALWLAICSTLLAVALFFVLIVPPFIDQFQNLLELLPTVWNTIRIEIKNFESQLPAFLPTPPSLSELIGQLQPLQANLITNFLQFFRNSLGIILQTLLIVVLTIMMVVDPQGYRKACLCLFPSFYRRRADRIFTECETALGNWMEGVVISSFFVGVMSGVGLWVLGVRLVLAHAILAGLLNFIPNIGPTLSVIFPVMIALLDAPWKIVAVLILYFIIQNIESYLLTPTVMAKQVSLLPAVTLVAQIFFAKFFGALGLLLALPLTVIAKTWIQEALLKDILDKWEKPQPDEIIIPALSEGISELPSSDLSKEK
jgi:predicted PurR-regulated permease PerM